MADIKGQPTAKTAGIINVCRFDDQCRPWLETAETDSREQTPSASILSLKSKLPALVLKEDIRVIEVKPGNADEHVQCSMTVQNLGSNHTALSYVWGNDRADYVVVVNGSKVRIRENLYRFLRAFQSVGDGAQKLWIDALCIDQTDLEERSHQVAMMGKIYSSAQHVIAWLGSGVVRLRDGFEFMKNECLAFQHHNKNILRRTQKVPLWQAVLGICKLEYWTRLWIVQEVLNAQNLSLVYGGTAVSWDDVCLFMKDIQYRRSCSPDLKELLESSKLMNFVRLKSGGAPASGSHSMSELLQIYGLNQCADLRDRIFALLPLASDADSFEVDYTLSTYDLFLRTLANDEHGNEIDKVKFMQTLIRILNIVPSHGPTLVNGLPTVVFHCIRCQRCDIVVRSKADESWRAALLNRFHRRDDLSVTRPHASHYHLYTNRIRYNCSNRGVLCKARQQQARDTLVFRQARVEAVHVVDSQKWLKVGDWSTLASDNSDAISVTSVQSASAVSLSSHQRSKSSSSLSTSHLVRTRLANKRHSDTTSTLQRKAAWSYLLGQRSHLDHENLANDAVQATDIMHNLLTSLKVLPNVEPVTIRSASLVAGDAIVPDISITDCT